MNNKQITLLKLETYQASQTGLKQRVAQIIVNNADDYGTVGNWFEDLFQHGCVSGMVSELIYYTDTHAFAKEHIEEILELKQDLEDDMGEAITDRNKGDVLNWLAWLGFEETARIIYRELGGEDY